MKSSSFFTCFIVPICAVAFLFGCQPPGPTPTERWESDLRVYKDVLGYDVMSVSASEAWIEKYKDDDYIDIPEQIAFGEPYHVAAKRPADLLKPPFISYMMILIAMDPKGNRRVLVRERPGNEINNSPPGNGINNPPDGYLSAGESRQWLSDNGYEVTDTASGFQIKNDSTGYEYGPIDAATVVGSLPEGVTLIKFNGKIYISDKK